MVHQSLATMIYNAMFLCGLFLMLVAARGNAHELMLRAPLVPVRSTTVYAGMNARMQQVNFEVGDRVTQGDTLMVLSRRDLRVKEAAARIALKKAQTLKARLEMLHDKKMVSDQQLENVRFDAEVAHYNWVAARMELDRTAIIAPQDGMVVEVNVKAGDWILAYTAVARIIDPYGSSGASVCVREKAERDPNEYATVCRADRWQTARAARARCRDQSCY